MILNVYTPNNRDLNCTKQKPIVLKGERDKSEVVAGDFNLPIPLEN